jgi:hypothetical protein
MTIKEKALAWLEQEGITEPDGGQMDYAMRMVVESEDDVVAYTKEANVEWVKQHMAHIRVEVGLTIGNAKGRLLMVCFHNDGTFQEDASHACGGTDNLWESTLVPDGWEVLHHVSDEMLDGYFATETMECLIYAKTSDWCKAPLA